jgi:hypothetical protein
MKTSELTGAALDWAVAKADEERDVLFCQRQYGRLIVRIAGDHETRDIEWPYTPSTDWTQGGPIIERKKIATWSLDSITWAARDYALASHEQQGPTPLIAAMRCYVASELGDEVEVPEDLVSTQD